MPVTVRGLYRDGRVDLLEKPANLREGPVEVTLAETQPDKPGFLQYGKYRAGRPSSEEDFRMAEWHGDEQPDCAQ